MSERRKNGATVWSCAVCLCCRLRWKSVVLSGFRLCTEHHAHQVGHGAGIGLVHDRSAVCFHGLDRDAEVIGDLFIESTGGDALKHLLLACGELAQQCRVEVLLLGSTTAIMRLLEHAFDELL